MLYLFGILAALAVGVLGQGSEHVAPRPTPLAVTTNVEHTPPGVLRTVVANGTVASLCGPSVSCGASVQTEWIIAYNETRPVTTTHWSTTTIKLPKQVHTSTIVKVVESPVAIEGICVVTKTTSRNYPVQYTYTVNETTTDFIQEFSTTTTTKYSTVNNTIHEACTIPGGLASGPGPVIPPVTVYHPISSEPPRPSPPHPNPVQQPIIHGEAASHSGVPTPSHNEPVHAPESSAAATVTHTVTHTHPQHEGTMLMSKDCGVQLLLEAVLRPAAASTARSGCECFHAGKDVVQAS